MTTRRSRTRIAGSVLPVLLLFAVPVIADPLRAYHFSRSSLDAAVKRWAAQSHLQIDYFDELPHLTIEAFDNHDTPLKVSYLRDLSFDSHAD